MMDIKSALEFMLKSNEAAIRKLWGEITDDESLTGGRDNLTHIRWISGHITNATGFMLNILRGRNHAPQGWDALFRGGREMEADYTRYPSMDEIRNIFDSNRREIYSALEKISTEELETKREIAPGWETTLEEALLFLCNHEFYHAGQISTLRCVLGKERAFG
jgi:uncharacterized damage-inducible protein DinB